MENVTLASTLPGEIITFGTYPQTADVAEKTPIKWRVLQNSGRELFTLSEYILDCRRYHGECEDITWRDCVDITWRDCDLRKWLNNEFYNTAFNAAEKGFIVKAEMNQHLLCTSANICAIIVIK
ncbi:DUF6273 domain-containing protein [Paenibacillus elgii]|uniref:DUF6273 domain-containing protein n=1 Tax=Paenibacillus elgii TaxID=189691 RepID=UPI000248C5CC|nr:DUF6273 domain-containing protein [Paenibacillus elgii]